MFDDFVIICSYTREDAIAEGDLVDASSGDLAEVSRQHFKYPIAMTRAVFELVETAVNNQTHCNDWKGVWHDILWMSRVAAHRKTDSTRWFRVVITGTGDQDTHELKMMCHPGDNGEPVLTVMLPHED